MRSSTKEFAQKVASAVSFITQTLNGYGNQARAEDWDSFRQFSLSSFLHTWRPFRVLHTAVQLCMWHFSSPVDQPSNTLQWLKAWGVHLAFVHLEMMHS